MGLQRPTLQGRAGFNPSGFGPGLSAPYGYSSAYDGMHNGEDYFWLGKESSLQLGISTEQSKRVYAVVDGPMHHIDDAALGLGIWQQIDREHRTYSWHLRDRQPAGNYTTDATTGRMGSTGTAAGEDEHLHFEVRRAPYRKSDRVNPAPFFASLNPSGDPTEQETEMPILVSLVQGNPPQHVGDHAIIGDGGVVGLQAARDKDLINTAKRAMWDREPVYGAQADRLAALFARVAVKVPAAPAPVIDYAKLAAELAKLFKVPTAAENAAATDAVLKDDFANVNANVNKPRTVQ